MASSGDSAGLTNQSHDAPIPHVRTNLLCVAFLSLCSLVGCENDAKSPYDIEVTQRSSALSIPKRVDRANKSIRGHETKAKEKIATIPTSADKIADTDWNIVLEIVDASDDAGKDGAYAAEMRDLEIAQAFFDEEKDDFTKKIGGSVQAAAKGCEVDAWGAVSSGMKRAMTEAVEDRLKENNDAFLIIDRNKDALGKKNIAALETMASDIADASYTVNVAMPNAKQELEDMIAASGSARSEIKKYIDEENAPPREGAKTSAESEKSKKDRLKIAEERLTLLDAAEADAKANLADLEQRTKDLQKSYDNAISALKDAIKAKKGS